MRARFLISSYRRDDVIGNEVTVEIYLPFEEYLGESRSYGKPDRHKYSLPSLRETGPSVMRSFESTNANKSFLGFVDC